ncbi:MAG: hypothetical protein MK081_15825 [Flavobacteriales bacterium]|nr:hypothetical protein [Flavobacteriales bacterium]
MSLLGMFMTVAFTNAAALRDFDRKFDQILYTAPIHKGAYLFGRYLSSLVLSLLPMVFVLLALVLATFFADSDQVGPNKGSAYLFAFLFLVLPNVIIASSLLYTLAVKTRKSGFGFAGAMLLCIGYLLSMGFLDNLESDWAIYLLDPFGLSVLGLETKYWTIEDLNTPQLPLSPGFLLNRAVWLVFSIGMLSFMYFTFTFQKESRKTKKVLKESNSPKMADNQGEHLVLPKVKISTGTRVQWKQLWVQFRVESRSLLKSTSFRLIVLFGLLNTIGSVSNADTWFGTGNLPVSFIMTDAIKGSLYLVFVIIIGFYSGQLVWAERKAQMNEIIDASPQASWVPLLSKFLVITRAILLLMVVNITLTMVIQLMKGYANIDPMVYFVEIILLDLPYFMLITAAALLVHVLINKQYIGFFVFLLLLIFHLFIWPVFDIDSNLLTFGGRPEHTYSDMSKWAPFSDGLAGYTLYWSLVGTLLLLIGSVFWVKGKPADWSERFAIAKSRFHGKPAMIGLLLFLSTGGVGCALFYQSNVLNEHLGADARIERAIAYEQNYKQFEHLAQPTISTTTYEIDLYPASRGFEADGHWWVVNKSDQPIDAIHFTKSSTFDITIAIPNSTIQVDDQDLGYIIFDLGSTLNTGDSIQVDIHSTYYVKGIENNLTLPNLTQNGIFLNNKAFMPTIGYNSDRELSDKDERIERGLEEQAKIVLPGVANDRDRRSNFLGRDADWVTINTIVSTSEHQTAIAPGKLIRSWSEEGRNFYEYRLDKKVMNFFAVMSAEYDVKRENWHGIDLEVYHHPGHDYNVDKMMSSMKSSIGYYSSAFSPYPHEQARIIEFPRFAQFAQAFPGTMPYSESIGFLSDLKDPDDIDGVTYVVAHEMGHQWWAHQLVGANVRGAQMLSETFSQYSALMVMERTYGAESMDKFLKYEMDKYLRSRSRLEEEPALINVINESSVYYNKGSVAMYALKEYISEDSVNLALRRFMNEFGYNNGHYPTSLDFLEEINAVTPDSLSYLVSDFFEHVTLYENYVGEASYTQRADGRYEIKASLVTNKFHSTGKGLEEQQPMNDWIEVGVKSLDGERLLYKEMIQFDGETHQVTIITEEEPSSVQIDPRYLLPDKFPENNIRKITLWQSDELNSRW